MDKEIVIGNNKLTLTHFRSFIYNEEKYTIFIDMNDMDEEIPAVYLLLNKNGNYTVPDNEILNLLNPVCIDILYNNAVYDSTINNYPDIKLLSWNE